MTKRKNKSVEIITDPKRIKKISVITTTIDFFYKESQDTEDIKNVCRINPDEDSDEDSDYSDEDFEDEDESSDESSKN